MVLGKGSTTTTLTSDDVRQLLAQTFDGLALSAKRAEPDPDTGDLEREIDQLVYQLFGLTPEEIAIVEGAHTA